MNTSGTLASRAVARALDDRQREAGEEVERILSATVRVMERVAPEAPRVSDIVAEAGSSKKAFYRYFAGKDDLLLAVLERGVGIVTSYLEHQMAKADRAEDKIERWICGALAQVADPHLVSMSRAVAVQLALTSPGSDDAITAPMRDLLITPIASLDVQSPMKNADNVFQLTLATMRRYVSSGSQPGADDIDNVVRFCLRGLGVS